MLYNKNWDAKTVTSDPFTLESLIAWLEKQPSNKTYCFMDTGGCLFHQYFTAAGFDVAGVGGTGIRFKSDPERRIRFTCDEFRSIASIEPHTFGAALTRARHSLAQAEG